MLWLIGFGLLVIAIFIAGLAKGGFAEGGNQVISLIMTLIKVFFYLAFGLFVAVTALAIFG
ncbi:MAG: hypothetical protein EOM90_17200 [Alphaproteobacteria bacterium]|nr:hypothetical protein [Alphaproteobacteria bacterium]